MNLKDLAKNLPYPLKPVLKYVYGAIPIHIRYGKVFRDTYAFLQESQWWSREQLEEYQLQQLSKLLQHAYENVPYYRRVFDERGLKPKDIQDFKDLQMLPYLTKQIIQDNLEDLKARNYPSSKFKYVT
ncbi:MAG: phenylacetate--CoA ligase family protein, partial [Methanophagales archaeon]|nr:phenylacetate--CoA ligase family protein [Methanophagales archaeon]